MPTSSVVPTPVYGGFSPLGALRVLLRRKWWVVLTFLATLGLGIAYLTSLSPIYEASIRLRIGQVAGGGHFEAADVLTSRLLAQYGEKVADGIRRERPFLARAMASKTISGGVDLVTQGDDPESAVELLRWIYEDIRKAHAVIHDRSVGYMTERLESIDDQQAALQQQYKDVSSLMDQLKDSNPVQASLLAIERGRIVDSMTRLAAEKPEFANKLAPPLTKPTELLGEIAEPAAPSAPRKAVILAVAMSLGVIFGVLLAFVVDFLAYARLRSGPPRAP